MRAKLLLIPLIALFVCSCIRDYPLDFPDTTETLYVSAQISNRDTAHVFFLSLSSGDKLKSPVADSRVECREGSSLLAVSDSVWNCESDDRIMGVRLPKVAEPGHEYRFDFYSGEHHAYSVVRLEPEYTLSPSLDTLSVPSKKEFGMKFYERFAIVFKDIPGQRSYYQASDTLKGRLSFWKEGAQEPVFSDELVFLGSLSSYNPLLKDENSYVSPDLTMLSGTDGEGGNNELLLLSDYSLQDSEFSIYYDCFERHFLSGNWGVMKDKYDYYTVTCITSLSLLPEDQFRYLSLLISGGALGNNILNEPVIFPDNIIDGYGFVGVTTVCDIEIDLGRREKS